MLCPIRPGAGTRSNTSNWLDRLRLNKGFFTDSTSPESTTHPTEPNRLITTPPQTTITATTTRSSEGQALMDILSDLFNTGPHNPNPIRKASRKQANPRPLLVSQRNDQNALLATSTSSNENNNAERSVGNEEDDGGEVSMKGFSRSEVTIMDTSCEVWKSDKLVFRKENVWRVREKKGRTGPWKGRKRKRSEGESLLGLSDRKNVKPSGLGSIELSESRKPQEQDREELGKETREALGQVAKKRLRLCRSPRQLNESTSSVVLIKAMPTSKKIRTKLSKELRKEMQKQP